MASTDAAGEAHPDVTVRFQTTNSAFAVPNAPISLPGNLNQVGLSKVINHLLGNAESNEVLFEFYLPAEGAARTFLRASSLIAYLASAGVSAESTVTLEYLPAMKPPESGPSKDLPAWVSCVTGTDRYIVAGLTNGQLAINAVGEGGVGPLIIPAHAGNITGIHAVDITHDKYKHVFATSGEDFLVKLWVPEEAPASKTSSAEVILSHFAELRGSMDVCGPAAINASAEHVVCGDAGGSVNLWKVPTLPAGDAPRHKRPRKNSTLDNSSVVTSDPVHTTTSAHGGSITGAAWASSSVFATCGWDNLIKVWDVEAGVVATTVLHAPKAVHCISASPLGSVLVTGHPDGAIRVWDTRGRTGGESAAARIEGLKGSAKCGSGWISSVAWCPTSSFHIAEACYDGSVAVWDIRALSAALFQLEKHDGKALCVGWAGENSKIAVSGGSDSKIRTNVMQTTLS